MASIAPYSAAQLHSDLAISSSVYGLVNRVESAYAGITRQIHTWRRRAAARRELASLSDGVLRDIGITRFEAQLEAEKPFWRD